ncbi:MAG: HD domain-containing phosphohydrolase, partial [Acidobacteriota bacterium]
MTMSAGQRKRLHDVFVGLVFVAGLAALVDAVRTLASAPMSYQWIVLAALVAASGWFAVKVPSLNATLSISETFLFSLVMGFGGAPAVVAVALDGLTVSLFRRRRNLRHVLFNLGEPSLSIWVASRVYYALAGVPPLSLGHSAISQIVLPTLALAAVYFVMNSVLNALAVATESGSSPFGLWRKYFLWVSLNYFGSASIALMVSANSENLLFSLLTIAPLVVVSYFTFKSTMGRLEDSNKHLGDLNRLYLKVVETLAMAVDAKDQVTHGHVCRVQTYSLKLAKALNVTGDAETRAIEAAALLHDMGKLAVPEHILNKPGKLTPDEYDRIKLHAPAGADMLSAVDFPYPVVPIVRHHHENWDGTGYPDCLKGDAIPIGARILSVVDCYDALRSHRPYRRALSPPEAMAIVKERKGTMYDPVVVEAFEGLQAEIEAASVDEPLPEVLDRFAQAAREMRRPDPVAEVAPIELRLSATDTLLKLYDRLSRFGPHAGLEDTCDVITRSLRSMAPAGLVAFFRREDATDAVVVAYASGFGEALMSGARMGLGHGVSGWVAANRRSVINADPALDVPGLLVGLNPQFRSVLSVPLVLESGAIGAVTLYSIQDHAFTDDQRQAIELVSGPMAEAFGRALAQRDAETHLDTSAVHPSHEHALAVLLEKDSFWHATSGRALGVLYVRAPEDGDIMAHASVAVTQATRIADLIFRPQHDELIVLMPDCDPGAGQLIVDRISAALPHAVAASIHGPSPLQVAFACEPYDGRTVRDLVSVAKLRLG